MASVVRRIRRNIVSERFGGVAGYVVRWRWYRYVTVPALKRKLELFGLSMEESDKLKWLEKQIATSEGA